MRHQLLKRISLLLVTCLALIVAGPVAAQEGEEPAPEASLTILADSIVWQLVTGDEYQAIVLTVSGPDDLRFTTSFEQDLAPTLTLLDPDGVRLPDGSYTYELRVLPTVTAAVAKAFAEAMESHDPLVLEELQAKGLIELFPSQSGYFTISAGEFIQATLDEATPAGAQIEGPDALAPQDQVILDDLIVDGSLCVGFDCVNGESFGFDTIRLKENNIRIKFQDTSNSGSFPSNDWQITINDSENGGANKFSIDDIDSGRTPFTIEASAPTNTLYVDSGGRIGVRTNAPVTTIHTVNGNTPTLRLEQDGSSGFLAQTWDVGGNEANFFIRDVSNGSTLPFKIRPSAPSNALVIDADGDIGSGMPPSPGPDASLEIRRSDGTAQVLVNETSTTEDKRVLLRLVNNGPPQFQFEDSSSGVIWGFQMNNSGHFAVNLSGTGGAEFEVQRDGDIKMRKGSTMNLSLSGNTGDVVLRGSLTENGNPTAAYEELDSLAIEEMRVLPSLGQITFATDLASHQLESLGEDGEFNDVVVYARHIRPEVETFNTLFNLGGDGTGIAPMDVATISLISAQELSRIIEKQDAIIQTQEARISDLEARLAALETLILSLKKNDSPLTPTD